MRIDSVIHELNADIIAFQEINNKAALENVLSKDYNIVLIDDPKEVHEVALAVRSPFKVISSQHIFADKKYDDAFPRSRNCLEVEVEIAGKRLFFLVQHYKSRGGGRMKTDARREKASELIVQYIKEKRSNDYIVVLGDFNDSPDDRSLNILEYGTADAKAGIDTIPDTFLFNSSEELTEKNMVSFGLGYTYKNKSSKNVSSIVLGSRAENNKWRNKEYNYYKDVKIKDTLLDQILFSQNLKKYIQKSGVFVSGAAVRGTKSKIKFTKEGLIYTFRGSFASDHVPVYTDLKFY